MKLDKIKFARLVSFIGTLTKRDLDYKEIQGIDDIVDVEPFAVPINNNNNLEVLMQEMANGKSKINAIKYHRALTGMSLKDSKDTVEKYWRVPCVEFAPKMSAKELQDRMLDVLNEDRCSIKSVDKVLFRDFISSFSCYS